MATADLTRGVASGPIRWGLRLIAVAGLLFTGIFAYWMTVGDLNPETDPKAYADYATSIGGLGSGVAYLVAILLLLLGVLALYGVLASGQHHRLALVGLVLNMASLSAVIAAVSALTLAGAVVASLYAEGQTGVAPALVKLSGGTVGTAILAAFLVAVALALPGVIVTGIAIWRSGMLPRWTAIVFGLGFVLFAASIPFLTMPGGLLLVIASIGMARSLEHAAPRGAVEARPV